MVREHQMRPLPAFAVYIGRHVLIGHKDPSGSLTDIVWRGLGPYGVPILARRDGFIIFNFPAVEKYAGGIVPEDEFSAGGVPDPARKAEEVRADIAYRRFDYMNGFMLPVALQEPVHPYNYFQAIQGEAGWELLSRGKYEHQKRQRLSQLETAILDHSIEAMNKCQAALGEDSIVLLSLLYAAGHHNRLHQFASAQVIAWSVVEMLVNRLWGDLLGEVAISETHGTGHTQMSKDRRKVLGGPDYSASVVSQILSITNKIDDPLLERLDRARKTRNDFAHGIKKKRGNATRELIRVTPADAGTTLRLATDLLSRITRAEVHPNLSIAYWGI